MKRIVVIVGAISIIASIFASSAILKPVEAFAAPPVGFNLSCNGDACDPCPETGIHFKTREEPEGLMLCCDKPTVVNRGCKATIPNCSPEAPCDLETCPICNPEVH